MGWFLLPWVRVAQETGTGPQPLHQDGLSIDPAQFQPPPQSPETPEVSRPVSQCWGPHASPGPGGTRCLGSAVCGPQGRAWLQRGRRKPLGPARLCQSRDIKGPPEGWQALGTGAELRAPFLEGVARVGLPHPGPEGGPDSTPRHPHPTPWGPLRRTMEEGTHFGGRALSWLLAAGGGSGGPSGWGWGLSFDPDGEALAIWGGS